MYKVNQGLAVFATMMNDWAAMAKYPVNIAREYMTPWNSAAAEQLSIAMPNGYNENCAALYDDELGTMTKAEIEKLEDFCFTSSDIEKFLDRIEEKGEDGHNWGRFSLFYL